MFEARTIGMMINKKSSDVYGFVREPMNLAAWANSFCVSVAQKKKDWYVESGDGTARVQFETENSYGVLDFTLRLVNGEELYYPMRVVPHKDRCEVMLTIFRLPEVSEENFLLDGAMAANDLRQLKETLESI
ncbi:SRPBCC family protein [Halobacillus sp. Marseille-Q1614]|uniref:SRPBCC family protein n=1 Tax=Halobacillus sp. Marseille-Q1614 TaxID=2709134 RepID=UPI00156F4B72|nr:SRPBCC family protein [Halobacillus sp. Marseille-Q1614]